MFSIKGKIGSGYKAENYDKISKYGRDRENYEKVMNVSRT